MMVRGGMYYFAAYETHTEGVILASLETTDRPDDSADLQTSSINSSQFYLLGGVFDFVHRLLRNTKFSQAGGNKRPW